MSCSTYYLWMVDTKSIPMQLTLFESEELQHFCITQWTSLIDLQFCKRIHKAAGMVYPCFSDVQVLSNILLQTVDILVFHFLLQVRFSQLLPPSFEIPSLVHLLYPGASPFVLLDLQFLTWCGTPFSVIYEYRHGSLHIAMVIPFWNLMWLCKKKAKSSISYAELCFLTWM